MAARPVVLVGEGELAREWLSLLRRSSRLSAAGVVDPTGTSDRPGSADLERFASIAEAVRARPGAAFAVALGPRAGLEAARVLAAAGLEGVVQAPLHDPAGGGRVPGAAGVRVAHGWVTLPGLQVLRRIVDRSSAGTVDLEIAGVPDGGDADLDEALVHAAAAVHALFPFASPTAARLTGSGAFDAEFISATPSGTWSVGLRLRAKGCLLAARSRPANGGGNAEWSFADGRETVTLDGLPVVPQHSPPPAAVRALAQLLPDASRGDDLDDSAAVLSLVRGLAALLPERLPPGGRALKSSATIARARPSDLLARLGLRGNLPAAGRVPSPLRVALPPEPLEYWAFRAGLKPVTFLTVRPEEVERTLAFFDGAAFERRDRRVRIGPQDEWVDHRGEGEPRVELFISRDAALAREAARLQEADPSGSVRAIGKLVGYPPCCVEAFERQDDRANNSRNRYATRARSLAPDGTTRLPWPWPLNNLLALVAPFYPCSYLCPAAESWAHAALAAMERDRPDAVRAIRSVLGRPVLYFDHDHQLAFDGECDGRSVAYRSVAPAGAVSAAFGSLAAAVGLGDRLTFDDESLLVERAGTTVFQLGRTDPALGFVAPFGFEKGDAGPT